MHNSMKAIKRVITSMPTSPNHVTTNVEFLKIRYSIIETIAAPAAATNTPTKYNAGELGICAPSAIDAAIVPGPVVSGNVIGKKLRLTTSALFIS